MELGSLCTTESYIDKQAERLAKMLLKPPTEGSIKRKKHVEEKDPRPKPPKVSKDMMIKELLGRLYGDREFLDHVLEEAGWT